MHYKAFYFIITVRIVIVDFLDHRSATAKSIENSYRALSPEEMAEYEIYSKKCPDPTISVCSPNTFLHSLPERLREDLDDYKTTNPDKVCTLIIPILLRCVL